MSEAWTRGPSNRSSGSSSKPESGWPTLNMNSWRGAPYVYDEFYHPTAWLGRQAVQFLKGYAATNAADAANAAPFFLKVSWHRPHSSYDPPARLLNATTAAQLPPIRTSPNKANGWDRVFTGKPGARPGCGPVF